MKKTIILWVVVSIFAVLFSCITIAAGAMWGVCLRSILGGVICMVTYLIVILETANVLMKWDNPEDEVHEMTP